MPQHVWQVLGLVLAGATALAACSGDDKLLGSSQCASGLAWAGGDEGSSLMHPGGDCIACHERAEEGPIFEIAGTVYEALTEEDDCAGIEGATIELVDINERVFTMTSNAAGNFYMTAEDAEGIEYPTTGVVTIDGRTSLMLGPVPYGNCVDCHTRTGNWTASGGRIFVP